MKLSSMYVEVDMDLDNYSATDVDKLNVLALEYGIAASSFSKLVSLHLFHFLLPQ